MLKKMNKMDISVAAAPTKTKHLNSVIGYKDQNSGCMDTKIKIVVAAGVAANGQNAT